MIRKSILALFLAAVSLPSALAQIPTANVSTQAAANAAAQRRRQLATYLIAESLMETPLASAVTGPDSTANPETQAAAPAQDLATPPDPKYPVKIRILYCRLILGAQDIRAVIDGKKLLSRKRSQSSVHHSSRNVLRPRRIRGQDRR
jgi:hypothetical protein